MHAESSLVGTAIGASIGVLGWVVGLGAVLWPEHPQWALFFIVIAVAVISTIILEQNDRRDTRHAHH